MIRVAPGMQDPHADVAAFAVYCLGYRSMSWNFGAPAQLARERFRPTGDVGCDSPGHDESCLAPCALCKVGSESGKVPSAIFQARVHRTHEHAVAQRYEPQIQWCEQ